MNNVMFLVKKSDLFCEDYNNIGLFKTRKLAEEYIKKNDSFNNYKIEKLKIFDDFNPEKTVIKTIISTIDGKKLKKINEETFISNTYVCKDNEDLQIFKEKVWIEDENEVIVELISSRILSFEEKEKIVKEKYNENYSNLLQAYEYKIGDEVLNDKEICYVIKVLDNEKLFVLAPSRRTEIAYTSKIKPTGRFSSKIKEMFDENNEIQVD